MRIYVIVMMGLMAATSAPAVAELEPCLIALPENVGPDRLVSFEIELVELADALGLEGAALDWSGDVLAFAGQGDAKVSVPIQTDILQGSKVKTALLLPAQESKQNVYLKAARGAGRREEVPSSLSVRQEGGQVIVSNGYVEVVHDPALQGGLPSKVTMLGTGRVFEGFRINDRLYDKGRGQFFLHEDREATVRLVRKGPLEVEIEVEARYLQGGRPTASEACAVYTFTYRTDTPAIRVQAHCVQNTPTPWPEYHLMEWNFPDKSLMQWTGGIPRVANTFQGEKEQASTNRWGALSDGENVFGLVCPNVKFYSGAGSYGGYIHGPWTTWSSSEQTLECVVWLDSEPGTLDRLEALGASKAALPTVRLTTPKIEELRASVWEAVEQLPKGRLRGLHGWWASLIDRCLFRQGRLVATMLALNTQQEAVAEDADADQILGATRELVGIGSIQMTDELLLAWSIAEEGCAPLSLFSFTQELELLAGKAGPLWALQTELNGRDSRDWTSRSDAFRGTIESNVGRTRVVWRGEAEAKGLSVSLTSELEGAQCAMRLDIENDSESLSVINVRFPVLLLGKIGPSAEDDVVLEPVVSGKLAKAPLLDGLSFNAQYPSGWGPLQFTAQWDPDCGVYVGAHDPFASTKTVRGGLQDSASVIEIAVEWPMPDAGKPGNDFEQPGDAVIAAFTGDWFDACQIYRDWAVEEAEWWPLRGEWGRPDTPDWMREISVWALKSGSPEEVVGPVTRFAEFMGVPTAVHWYNWHEIPFDDDYPHYFPTKSGFADGVAELQAAGVRVMPYINGRLWDSDTDDFESVALPGATKDRNGKPYIETYGSGQELVPMCPTQPVWGDKVKEIVLRLVGPECNVDGVYIDQVAAAAPRLCYDASHGHPLGGGHWWTVDGYWPMLTDLQKRMAEQYPEKMLTTECSAEPYLQCFDAYLTWHYQHENAVPAVAAVCGEKMLFFSRAYNGNDQLAHRMKSAQALVFGEQLGWGPPEIIDTNPTTAAHLRRCARVRHQLLPYLAFGRMMRPPQVTGDIPNVTADWAWSGTWNVTDSALQRGAWQAEDGSVAFIFANSTEESIDFLWDFNGAAYSLSGDTLKAEEVREISGAAMEPLPRVFTREMTLGPLDVVAFVLRGA